jgi:muramoyltetrapeptide carboxypeptidase
MAIRGAYGMTRLLPHIDFERMAASGKIFVGYSDVTAFHMALYATTGALSYAGPMFTADVGTAEPNEFTLNDFWHCLAGPTHTISGHGAANPRLDATGIVWGGNLAMVMSLMGTPYFPRIDGGILFLEDIAEHPFRVERMLLQLMQAGLLDKQRAIVLGDFSGYRLGANDNGYNFDEMLAYVRATLPVPVLTGLEFGHIAMCHFACDARRRNSEPDAIASRNSSCSSTRRPSKCFSWSTVMPPTACAPATCDSRKPISASSSSGLPRASKVSSAASTLRASGVMR